MDTLIQLRQPQLSKKPDESRAVERADARPCRRCRPNCSATWPRRSSQLEEDRRQLEEYQALAKAVDRFEQRYRVYAGTRSRRAGARAAPGADRVRQRQPGAQRGAGAPARRREAAESGAKAGARRGRAGAEARAGRLETLRADPPMQDANRLESAERDAAGAPARAAEAHAATSRRRSSGCARDAEETARAWRSASTQAEARLADARAGERGARRGGRHRRRLRRQARSRRIGAAALVALTAADVRPGRAAACARLAVDAPRADRAAPRPPSPRWRRPRRCMAQRRRGARRDRRRRPRPPPNGATQRRRRPSNDEGAGAGRRLGAPLRAACEQLAAQRRRAARRRDGAGRMGAFASTATIRRAGCLQAAQQDAQPCALAQRRVALDGRRQALEGERAALEDERSRLEAGVDAAPPAPYTRDRRRPRRPRGRAAVAAGRFRDRRSATAARRHRGGAGSRRPARRLGLARRPPAGGRRRQAVARHPGAGARPAARALARRLAARPRCRDGCPVPAGRRRRRARRHRLRRATTRGDGEAWVAPDGRFRLGALAGAWAKPEAVYIGYAARAAARARRLADIAERLAQLADELARLQAASRAAGARRSSRPPRNGGWRPPTRRCGSAHLDAAARARRIPDRPRAAGARPTPLPARRSRPCSGARERLAARRRRPAPAGIAADALPAVEAALDDYLDAQARLCQAASELRQALPELRAPARARAGGARRSAAQRGALAGARIEAEEADARLEVLRETVGAKVEELQRQLAEARADVEAGERALKAANARAARVRRGARRRQGEGRARRARHVRAAQQRSAPMPSPASSGSRPPACSRRRWPEAHAARLAGQLDHRPGAHPGAPHRAGARRHQGRRRRPGTACRRQVAEELHRAAARRSARAATRRRPRRATGASSSTIVYQNRPERPDRLARVLAEEIAQRSELLTAKEREVLENHLQAEIASEIQRLLQARRDASATRSTRSCTSARPPPACATACCGSRSARRRARRSASRRRASACSTPAPICGRPRTAASSARCCSSASPPSASAPMRIGRHGMRRQPGRATGPRARLPPLAPLSRRALAGRAAGASCPAPPPAASARSASRCRCSPPWRASTARAATRMAPRLMLLDEAFAGIDDAARAHCMGLIREFDLDFVITSEREWACYAELPGVSICQLQRQGGHRRGLRLALDLGRPRQDARGRSGPQVRAAIDRQCASHDPMTNSEPDQRLQRLLGGSELAGLRRRLRRHFERAEPDAPSGSSGWRALLAHEYTVLASLMGRRPRLASSIEVDIAQIDAMLARAGIAASLRAALEALDGAIVHLPTALAESSSRWAKVAEGPRHPGLARLLQSAKDLGLLKRLARQDPGAAERILQSRRSRAAAVAGARTASRPARGRGSGRRARARQRRAGGHPRSSRLAAGKADP